MQVSVEESGAIERKLAISVPSEKIESEIARRLKDVAKKARIPGFRPGKAPSRVIQKRFSPGITSEVITETIQSSYMDALGQEKIVPAGLVSIEPTPYESGKDLEYVATVEVFPEIPSPTLDGATIRKPVVEVTGQDIDNTLEDIRRRNADFVVRQGKAENGDRLTVSMEGEIGGEKFEQGSVESHSFILGEGEMPEEFEKGLAGVGKDEVTTITVSYPPDHDNPELAGREVNFSVTTKAVEKPELAELDDKFAETLGIREGGIEKMKQEIEKNLSLELDNRLRSVIRNRVMNGLLEKNSLEPPKTLVEEEINQSVQRFTEYMAARNLPTGEIDRDRYADEAGKRVSLSLIVRAIIDSQDIKVDPEQVKARVTEMSSSYEQPEAYVSRFMADPEQLQRIQAVILEDQVVKLMLETATVEDESISFRDFMNTPLES